MIRAHTSPYSFFILSFKRGKLGVGDELKLLVLNNPWEKVLSCNNPIKACKCSYPFVFLPLLCLSCLFPKKRMRFINPFPVGLTFLIHPSTPFIGRGLGNDPFYPSGQIWLSSIFAMNKGHEGRREEGEALSKSLWFHVFLSNYRSFLQLVSLPASKAVTEKRLTFSNSILAHLDHCGQKGQQRRGSCPYPPKYTSFPAVTVGQRTPAHPSHASKWIEDKNCVFR